MIDWEYDGKTKTLTISGSGEMEDYDGVDKDEPWSLCTVNIEKVIIESGITNIGDNAFLNCGKLVSVIIPDSVINIGIGAFFGCENLTSVKIPENTVSIGDFAFLDCSGLISATIPDSVTDIGYDAFANCDKLTIYCNKKSFAHTYAKKNKIKFKKLRS